MNKKLFLYKILLFLCYAIILGLQIAYIYINKNETYNIKSFTGHLSLSSSVVLLILIFTSKLHLLPERFHFSIFPLTYRKFLLFKLRYFIFNRYFIFVLLIYLSYFFNNKIDFITSFLFLFCTVCQYLFTVSLYFILWDILCIVNLNEHINILFFFSLFPSIILSNSINYKYLLFNPVSNTLSLPVYFFQANNDVLFIISFFIIPIFFSFIYLFLARSVKQWI